MKNKPNPIRISGSHSNGSKGFTLVELLVVITIIAVLAALTMTVTGNIRAKAQQANALSALRQIAGFGAAYSAENNGDINTLRWDGDKNEGPKGGNTWTINTFWGRFHDYLCPEVDIKNQPKLQAQLKQRLDVLFNTDTGSGRGKDVQGTTFPNTIISGLKINSDISGLAVPISFNKNLYVWDNVVKVSSLVGNPSQILYATYGSGFFNETDGKTYVPRPTKKTDGQPIYFMNDKKALFAFVDGHVEALSVPIPNRNFK
ncbi:MAG: hypothetical protein RLZZ214_1954 [Verrucomicrobiota bacterium]|jgi:prepilin-type N-terminal cleavage/methylation domain-containing protein/prepilin-type processing-associated H-X9-DG protein